MTIETPIRIATSRPALAEETRPHTLGAGDAIAPLTLNIALGSSPSQPIDAIEGLRVVELIRANGLPIKAECAGAGVCATCHVRIPAAWHHRLPAASADELAKLDEIPGAGEFSRLACQIEMTHALDGLELVIETDSLLTHATIDANRTAS